jgi:hypothetical protein
LLFPFFHLYSDGHASVSPDSFFFALVSQEKMHTALVLRSPPTHVCVGTFAGWSGLRVFAVVEPDRTRSPAVAGLACTCLLPLLPTREIFASCCRSARRRRRRCACAAVKWKSYVHNCRQQVGAFGLVSVDKGKPSSCLYTPKTGQVLSSVSEQPLNQMKLYIGSCDLISSHLPPNSDYTSTLYVLLTCCSNRG